MGGFALPVWLGGWEEGGSALSCVVGWVGAGRNGTVHGDLYWMEHLRSAGEGNWQWPGRKEITFLACWPRCARCAILQETPIVEVTRQITKHNFLVMDVADIPRVIKEAFYLARTGRPGEWV